MTCNALVARICIYLYGCVRCILHVVNVLLFMSNNFDIVWFLRWLKLCAFIILLEQLAIEPMSVADWRYFIFIYLFVTVWLKHDNKYVWPRTPWSPIVPNVFSFCWIPPFFIYRRIEAEMPRKWMRHLVQKAVQKAVSKSSFDGDASWPLLDMRSLW